MKIIKQASIVLIFLVFGCKSETKETTDSEMNHQDHQIEKTEPETKKKPLSPHTSTMAMICDAHIHKRHHLLLQKHIHRKPVHPESLEAWTVTSRIIYEYEKSLNL